LLFFVTFVNFVSFVFQAVARHSVTGETAAL